VVTNRFTTVVYVSTVEGYTLTASNVVSLPPAETPQTSEAPSYAGGYGMGQGCLLKRRTYGRLENAPGNVKLLLQWYGYLRC